MLDLDVNNGDLTGERIYRRGLALLSQKKTKLEENKKKILDEKMKYYSFTPLINKKSVEISTKNMYRDSSNNRNNFSYDQTLDKRVNQSRATYSKKQKDSNREKDISYVVGSPLSRIVQLTENSIVSEVNNENSKQKMYNKLFICFYLPSLFIHITIIL